MVQKCFDLSLSLVGETDDEAKQTVMLISRMVLEYLPFVKLKKLWRITILMGQLTISMAIFHSDVRHYQRLPAFSRTKSPSFVGKHTSTMEHMSMTWYHKFGQLHLDTCNLRSYLINVYVYQ